MNRKFLRMKRHKAGLNLNSVIKQSSGKCITRISIQPNVFPPVGDIKKGLSDARQPENPFF
ncbi:MAG: hypothetical protein BGO59_30405 [Spirosoma sp. 48-14]|nr:MAG: hypothetical protein BGO59_30405 [Spirosoma sp. 48-14]